MCTAFATANGALNYELNALYGSCGWDLEKPFNRASPRFVYNQTGIDLGGDWRACRSSGRFRRLASASPASGSVPEPRPLR